MNKNISSEIKVRKINLNFSEDIDRYWLASNPFKTHFLNSITLSSPGFEKYLILNVKQQLNTINAPELKQAAEAFIGQEGQHAIQHKKFWANLCLLNYKFNFYLDWLDNFFKIICQRLSKNFNLSICAGIEHFTTFLSRFILEGDFLKESEPSLKQLFEWHALEEIEHRAVLFDVLENANNSYLLRVVGMVISHIFIFGLLNFGIFLFLYQDKKLFDLKVWQEMSEFWFTKDKLIFKFFYNCKKYFKKDFHPLLS